MSANIGQSANRTPRLVLRCLGAALLLLGAWLVVTGGMRFAAEMNSPGLDGGAGPMIRLAAGGFAVVIGLALLSAGFLGAQMRYAAGETVPVLRDSAASLLGGPGPSRGCPRCGVSNDAEARFCDSCGTSLA